MQSSKVAYDMYMYLLWKEKDCQLGPPGAVDLMYAVSVCLCPCVWCVGFVCVLCVSSDDRSWHAHMCNPVRYYDDSKRYARVIHTHTHTHTHNRPLTPHAQTKDTYTNKQTNKHTLTPSSLSLVGYVAEHDPWPPEGGTVREVESLFTREFGAAMRDVVAQGVHARTAPAPAAAPLTTSGA